MNRNICIFLAAVFLLVPSMTHEKNIKHSSVALSAAGTSYSSGKQVLSSLGQALPLHGTLRVSSGAKYAISECGESGAETTLNAGDGMFIGLAPVYPNPVGPSTTIAYAIDAQAHVSLKIYDVSGRLVRILVDETKGAGQSHSVRWDGTDDLGQALPSGIYFCQFVAKEISQTRKVILLK
jgi:hypothetical protein